MKLDGHFNLAPRHKEYNETLFAKLNDQDEALVLSIATPESRQAYNWNKQVLFCYHRATAFARLKISSKGILYGRIDPEHYVEDMVAKWFSSRFPLFTIMVESARGTFVVTKSKNLEVHKESLSTLLPKFEKHMHKDDILSELEDFSENDIWKTYYDSQYIQARKNKRYLQKNIPKKFHEWEGLKCEKERFEGNRKLVDF